MKRRIRWLAAAVGEWTAAVVAVMAIAAVAVLIAAIAVTPGPGTYVSRPVDPYPVRLIPLRCNGAARPGLVAFKSMILSQVGGGNSGVYDCRPVEGRPYLSYHADSRAWDWAMDATKATDRARVDLVLNWLLRTDEHGTPQANARHLGIGEIIWNRRIVTLWGDHPPAPCVQTRSGMSCFQAYDGTNPHTDHVHFSFSTAGADGTTLWSTSRAAASVAWRLTNLPEPSPAPIAPFVFGSLDVVTVAADWDGGGRDTLGFYDPRDRRFYLRETLTSGPADIVTGAIGPFGAIPFVGDWNGDGIDEFGYYEPTTAQFSFVDRTGAPMRPPVVFGELGDRPLIGDWDGDRIDDVGVYRPSDGSFTRRLDLDGVAATLLGRSGDIPVTGHFDRDGRGDIGVFRPSEGAFHLQTVAGTRLVAYAERSATPIVGDWDGDGVQTPGIALPAPDLTPR